MPLNPPGPAPTKKQQAERVAKKYWMDFAYLSIFVAGLILGFVFGRV